jgi:CheY-like chemotaxis protein
MSQEAAPVRILIADDDAVLREIAVGVLRQAGFEVQAVASGDAAVAACALRMPDIALLDVEMPDGNGYQAREHPPAAGRSRPAHRHRHRLRRLAVHRQGVRGRRH